MGTATASPRLPQCRRCLESPRGLVASSRCACRPMAEERRALHHPPSRGKQARLQLTKCRCNAVYASRSSSSKIFESRCRSPGSSQSCAWTRSHSSRASYMIQWRTTLHRSLSRRSGYASISQGPATAHLQCFLLSNRTLGA